MEPVSSRRRLSEVARHVVTPDGITKSEWPSVRQTCARLGWHFDGWQDGAGMLILAQGADGQYAADVAMMSIPRQVGKTYLIACIIFALCLMKPGLKVVWTAQVKDTALETYGAFVAMAERPRVKPHIERTPSGKGDEAIVFSNGSVIEFGARDSGFGRGRTGIDVLVFDEGQHLSTEALENMGAAQNASRNSLFFVMGTPPRPRDKGDYFRTIRSEAVAGESDTTLYIELSADRDADSMDRDQWRKANPSFPHRTTERALLRLRKKLRLEDSWRREALGIWDDEDAATRLAVDPPVWGRGTISLENVGPHWSLAAVGVDMDESGRVWVAVAAHSEQGVHAELLDMDLLADGVDAARDWVWERCRWRLPLVMPKDSGATLLEAPLLAKKAKVYRLNIEEQAQASSGLVETLRSGEFTHLNDPVLAAVVREAPRVPVRKADPELGAQWLIGRSGDSRSAPLLAVAAARFGAVKWSRRRSGNGSSSGRVVTA